MAPKPQRAAMKHRTVYRVGNRWFAVADEVGVSHEIPQTRDAIEEFARQNGYEVVWDVADDGPVPGRS